MIKSLSNPAWAVIEYGWYPLLVFIVTPYLLHTLGPDRYGLWMLLTATVSFGAILNVGTGAATIKHVSARSGGTDSNDVEPVVRHSLAIALVGGGLIATLISIVFCFTGNAWFAKMGDQSLLRLTGLVAALLAWVEQIDNVFASTLKGLEEFGHAARVEIASKTIQIFAAVLAVMMWNSLTALYTTLILVGVLRLFTKYWITKKVLTISTLRPSFTNLSNVLAYARWGWLQGVGGLLFGVADRLLVGSFLGASSLAHYSVATQLAQQIHALSSAGMSVLFPKVSRKLAEKAGFSLWHIAKLTMAGNLLASGALALALLIFGNTILSLWLGTRIAESSGDALWYLTIAYWLLAINVVPHFILLGMGRIRFVAMANLGAGIVLLVAMALLVQPYGLVGIAVARILYGIIILADLFMLANYLWRTRGKSLGQIKTSPLAEGI